MPGSAVRVRIQGFPPNTAVTLRFQPVFDTAQSRPIGSGTTDQQGNGVVDGVIPPDAPFGDVALSVTTGAQCEARTSMTVVGSEESIRINDATVVPGQQVMITASGFAPHSTAVVYLDGDARDALCICHELVSGLADELGVVRIVVRIPGNVSRGAHSLTLNGDSFDADHELGLTVRIKVGG